jgi:hypothetical protein
VLYDYFYSEINISKPDSAIEHLKNAVRKARRAGDWYMESRMLERISWHFASLRMEDSVIVYLDKSAKANLGKAPKLLITNASARGRYFTRIGDLASAYDANIQYLNLIQTYKPDRPILKVYSLNDLAILAFDLKNPGQAKEKLLEAESIGERFDIQNSSRLLTKRLLGFYYQNYTENNDLAIEHYTAFLALAKKRNSTVDIAHGQRMLGQCSLKQKRYGKARKYFMEGIELLGETGSKHDLSLGYLDLAKVSMEEENYKEAIQYLHTIYEVNDSKTDMRLAKQLHENLAVCFAQIGKYDSAYANVLLGSAIKDSLFKEDLAAEIADLQVKYDSEKKDKAIISLEKEKALFEVENLRQQMTQRALIAGLVFLLLSLAIGYYLYVARLKNIKQAHLLTQQKTESKSVSA